MNIKDFFKKYDINCPEWLSRESLEEKWLDSEYSIEKDTPKAILECYDGYYPIKKHTHKWVIKSYDGTPVIKLFDGTTYLQYSIESNDEIYISMMLNEYGMGYEV